MTTEEMAIFALKVNLGIIAAGLLYGIVRFFRKEAMIEEKQVFGEVLIKHHHPSKQRFSPVDNGREQIVDMQQSTTPERFSLDVQLKGGDKMKDVSVEREFFERVSEGSDVIVNLLLDKRTGKKQLRAIREISLG